MIKFVDLNRKKKELNLETVEKLEEREKSVSTSSVNTSVEGSSHNISSVSKGKLSIKE